ncbi:xanthine phosphoribosyltransferase [Thiomicrorhabdus indica]|uniref:xanthine phosphoribosyltransferase n=1 Tax=Thiomicrorhabdus indica TaxID=2267253 RepID=UPI002AA913AE|nr:xanthine phosphoribosyltransferase [Thiomicrorhabdus indica]
MYQGKAIISWDQLHRDCRMLAHEIIKLDRKWDGIIAVTRGGMIPAAILARELGIRLVDSISVKTYSHQNISEPVVLNDVSATEDGDKFLLIDDLVDTGKTAKFVRERLPKAHFATVYAKPEGKPLVDTFITEFEQDNWIYFPWDLDLDYAKPISKHADE